MQAYSNEYKFCARCGKAFDLRSASNKKRYCSENCTRLSYRESHIPDMRTRRLLPSGTVGAISELVAAIHLARRGYHVFRAIDPACPCDLIAMRGTNLWRVQVRTGTFDRNGTPTCMAKGEHDVLACVVGEEVFYTPDMPDVLTSV